MGQPAKNLSAAIQPPDNRKLRQEPGKARKENFLSNARTIESSMEPGNEPEVTQVLSQFHIRKP